MCIIAKDFLRRIKKLIRLLILVFAFTALASVNVYAGGISILETDSAGNQLLGFFDLRDRESFIQITNTGSGAQTVHIQLFNVGNLCNENNFFDAYTPNDTHVYNLRDIITNDGNPSGVVLPENAYGIFVAYYFGSPDPLTMIGNLRIQDNDGYEYRTNLNGIIRFFANDTSENVLTFNFNNESGVTLSDVIGFDLSLPLGTSNPEEVFAADIVNIWVSFDIDILDLNEVPFSCRNVIFACTDQNNPLLEALLEDSGEASVASFEYGINEAIPSSKDAPLLCPNNVISEGFVRMSLLGFGSDASRNFSLFIGLNNGNGRGSMDSIWYDSTETSFSGSDGGG